jgi:2-dehydropantoate 2-reductase
MRIVVMGAGAIGAVTGGFLSKAGHEVSLVGRPQAMAAIARDGLHITGIWGEHRVTSLRVCSHPGEVADAAPPGLILIAVKSYDTDEAVEAIVPLLGPDTLVCSYQNGLGNAERIAARIGWARTVGARVIFGARVIEPGRVDVTVIANPTALGVYRPETPAGRVREIVELMDKSGMPTVYTEKIATVLWSKVAYNCALNPLSALLDAPYGVLAEMPPTRAIIHEVIEELYTVGHAMGIDLEPVTASDYLDLFFNRLIPPTAAHYASMREDFRLHRRTEIDALNGAIVRYGEEHGIVCPANRMLTRLVLARESAYTVPKS